MLRSLAAWWFVIAGLAAQDVRELSEPTQHTKLFAATPATISTWTSQGYRLIDLEHRSGSGQAAAFDAVLVRNASPYATVWWWYHGASAVGIANYLAANNARPIDLEVYEDGNGVQRFACVMVDNTGANNKPYWWLYDTTTAAIGNAVTANGARIVDIDSYSVGGVGYHSAVMIANSGADARGWWWYTNLTSSQVGAYVSQNAAQLYDLSARSNGNWDCVMVQNPTPAVWYWWHGLTAADVDYLIGQFGVRPFRLEHHVVAGSSRWAMVAINNSNALTTTVGGAMRSRTDGQVGCWMEQIGGPNLATLNAETPFEPASTMKTVHHAHAMKQVANGLPIATNLTVYSGYVGSCPQDNGPFQEGLQSVLQPMMENSDNARAQAVRAHFGEASIQATAVALGMIATDLNHRIGCATEAIANPNQTTLRDLHELHESVALGFLGSQRDLFYQLMRDDLTDLNVSSIIAQEGQSLGIPASSVATFTAFTRMAHKGGSYSLTSGAATWHERAEFGWLSLPWLDNGAVTQREYGFGAFVNDASSDPDANAAIYTDAIPAMLRPTIREALQSWTSSLASVTYFGAGCSGYVQSASDLPRLGSTVTYSGAGGHPSAPVVLGLGFSNAVFNGIPLPFSTAAFGGEPGCFLRTDLPFTFVAVADAAGSVGFPVQIPAPVAGLGFTFYTQLHSFGPTTFRSTSGCRSIVGF